MRMKPRTNTIILWIVSIGLMVGMVITFTPTLGAMGGQDDPQSDPALFVNGEPISEMDVQRQRQNPLYFSVQEGPVAEDLDLLLVDGLIRQEVLRQAASSERVGGGEVRQAVDDFREENGVAGRGNDEAYRRLINNAGFTDASFRDYMRQQLRVEQYQDSLTEDVSVSGDEVETYYLANEQQYQTEPRIEARQIVVDEEGTAEDLRLRVLAGESFAELAEEHSLERAEQGGAIGGEEPQPVGRPALPTAVAEAAFGLPGPGLTEVVESGGRYWLMQVENSMPAEPRPLEEVREQVREDVLEAKRNAAVQQRIEELRAEAEVTFPEGSDLAFENPVVASVGDEEIRMAELVRATYNNPQIQETLSQETASLVLQFFKPSVLEQLVDRKLAARGASELDASFFGTEAQVAQMALAYVARDAEASDEEIQAYYEENESQFTVPANADVLRAEFQDPDAAEGYREAVLEGVDPEQAAQEADSTLEDVGVVQPGELADTLDTALFDTDGFASLPDSELEVSDVLVVEEAVEAEAGEDAEDAEGADDGEAGEAAEDGGEEAQDGAPETREVHVVLVAQRTPERVRPLEEVREQVRQAVLQQQRTEAQEAWLSDLREEVEVENRLAEVQPEVEGAGAPLPGAPQGESEGAPEEVPAEVLPEGQPAPGEDEDPAAQEGPGGAEGAVD